MDLHRIVRENTETSEEVRANTELQKPRQESVSEQGTSQQPRCSEEPGEVRAGGGRTTLGWLPWGPR